MLTFLRGRALILAAGLAISPLMAPCIAQAQGEVGRNSPPPARVDPQAKTTLAAMSAAYKVLKSYSATVAVESKGGDQTQKQTVTLSFLRPSHAKMELSDETGPMIQSVVNGAGLFLVSVRSKQYVKHPAPPADAAIPAVLSQARGALLPTLAGNPDFLSRLFTQPGVSVTLGAPATIGGVQTDTIVLMLASAPGTQVKVTLSVGQDDHLLRQLTESIHAAQGGQVHNLTHVETVTEQAVDPALTTSAFAFVPPVGVRKVASIEPPTFDPSLVPGARPFAIATADLNGRPISLDQYKGKVVLMDFWATWCGPCVGEMPNVIAAYKKYHAQGFDVVGISLDQDKGALTSFLRQNKMPWRQVFDGKGWGSVVPRRYGVVAIPFGLLLNRDGTIAAVEVRGEALPAAIKVALARK